MKPRGLDFMMIQKSSIFTIALWSVDEKIEHPKHLKHPEHPEHLKHLKTSSENL